MIKELQYPFDANYILENKRKIKKELLENDIEIAADELTALQKQKEHYWDV